MLINLSQVALQNQFSGDRKIKILWQISTYKLGPFSSWPAMRRDTPKGRDCTETNVSNVRKANKHGIQTVTVESVELDRKMCKQFPTSSQ